MKMAIWHIRIHFVVKGQIYYTTTLDFTVLSKPMQHNVPLCYSELRKQS